MTSAIVILGVALAATGGTLAGAAITCRLIAPALVTERRDE